MVQLNFWSYVPGLELQMYIPAAGNHIPIPMQIGWN